MSDGRGCGCVLQVKVYRNKVMLTGVCGREADWGGVVWGWCGDRCLGRGRRQAWRVTAIKLCQLVRVAGESVGRWFGAMFGSVRRRFDGEFTVI